MTEVRRVVLVGGGHTHIQVLEACTSAPLRHAALTLLVDVPVAVYSGMVPGVVAGQYAPGEVELDPVALARRVGADVVIERAVGLDPVARTITTATGRRLPYDVASFDIGSTVAGLDVPGVREHALPTRPIGGFVERFSRALDEARRRPAGTPFRVVVVGAGAGGIEIAFTLRHRLERDTSLEVSVTLLDGGPTVLGSYPASLRTRVSRWAGRRGIVIRTGARVTDASAGEVLTSTGDRLPYDMLVWVTGAVSQPLFRDSGLPTDERGFVLTRSTLQFRDHAELFGVGDCATLVDYPRTPKAGVYAVRQGPVLTRNLRAFLAGRPLEPYEPQGDFLTLLNIGDGVALGAKWGFSFEGRWVMRLKDWIDRRFMRRFPSPE